MDITVRQAVAADLLRLLQLFSRSDEGIKPEVVSPTEVEITTWNEMLQTNSLTTYVAERESDLVGSALFATIPNLGYHCRRTGFIEALVVAAPYRRLGVATLLTQRILTDAGAIGCHKIQLLTHKRHSVDGAHDFYRAMGFEAEAEGFRLYL